MPQQGPLKEDYKIKVYNPDHNKPLKPRLKKALEHFRAKRAFHPKAYADAKAAMINAYFKDTPLRTAIVGLSGGIDSSVVAGLVAYAMQQKDSPIENIVTPTIPAHTAGATGQDDAARRAYDVMETIGVERLTIDIIKPHTALTKAVENAMGAKGDEWAKGQSVAHVRTMALAYIATLMQMQKKPGILIGTTNRDEGAYLGYVGKYSDALVDLQVISDLHKSEVYVLARHLSLPQSTIDAIPKGDLYDARVDTEVFGAPYDFVELYLNYLKISENEQKAMLESFNGQEKAQFDAMAANLEKLHDYNSHKYLGNQPGSLAYHLDIQRSGVPGGWQDTVPVKLFLDPSERVKQGMPGYFDLQQDVRDLIQSRIMAAKLNPTPTQSHVMNLPESCSFRTENAIVIESLLLPDEVEAIKMAVLHQPWGGWIPVGENGMRTGFDWASGGKIGSWRATTFSSELGELLWQRLKPILPAVQHIPNGLSVDAIDAEVWHAIGINTKLSFILYRPDDKGNLVTHYDAPFDYGDGRRTLKSCVLYLTDAAEGHGGATRFIKDPQKNIAPTERNLSDWTENASSQQVALSVNPKSGSALIFNHRVLHDSEPLSPESSAKLIMRTDIVYEIVSTP